MVQYIKHALMRRMGEYRYLSLLLLRLIIVFLPLAAAAIVYVFPFFPIAHLLRDVFGQVRGDSLQPGSFSPQQHTFIYRVREKLSTQEKQQKTKHERRTYEYITYIQGVT